ncbi:MAG: PilZ domain-containing protein [Novosphingobium sp.]
MNVVAGRFAEAQDITPVERRRSVRHSVFAEATITSSRGLKAGAELADLSSHGVRLVTEAPWLRLGQFVSITLESDAPVQAIVRWIRGGEAGMEFLRPIPADRTAWHAIID